VTPFNRPIKRPLAVFLALSLLAGCNTAPKEVKQDRVATDNLREQMHGRSAPFAVLQHGRAKIAGEEIYLKEEKEQLPPLFNETVAYATSGQMLKEALESISRQIGVPVWLTEFANEQPISATSTSSDDEDNPRRTQIQLQYEGSLQGLFDQLAQSARLNWRYRDGRVEFFLYETRHFYVNLPLGKRTILSEIQSQSSGEGGSQDSGKIEVKLEETAIDPFSVVAHTVAAILMEDDGMAEMYGLEEAGFTAVESESENSPPSYELLRGTNRIVVAPAMAMITVTSQPGALDRVADYIDKVNQRFSRNVMIDLKIYDLSLSDEERLGFSVNALFKKLGDYGLNVTGNGEMSIVRPPAGTATTGTAVVRALREFGDTSLVTSGQVIAINGQPAPLQVGSEIRYVSGVEARDITSGLGTTTVYTPTTSTLNTGLTANFLPQMLADNRILLQYQLTSRALIRITAPPVLNGVQLPEVEMQTINQQAFVRDGEAIVLFGFERDEKRSNSGLGIPLSATRDASKGRTLRVIVMQIFGGGANGNAAYL